VCIQRKKKKRERERGRERREKGRGLKTDDNLYKGMEAKTGPILKRPNY
jgi:hypothetical protein